MIYFSNNSNNFYYILTIFYLCLWHTIFNVTLYNITICMIILLYFFIFYYQLIFKNLTTFSITIVGLFYNILKIYTNNGIIFYDEIILNNSGYYQLQNYYFISSETLVNSGKFLLKNSTIYSLKIIEYYYPWKQQFINYILNKYGQSGNFVLHFILGIKTSISKKQYKFLYDLGLGYYGNFSNYHWKNLWNLLNMINSIINGFFFHYHKIFLLCFLSIMLIYFFYINNSLSFTKILLFFLCWVISKILYLNYNIFFLTWVIFLIFFILNPLNIYHPFFITSLTLINVLCNLSKKNFFNSNYKLSIIKYFFLNLILSITSIFFFNYINFSQWYLNIIFFSTFPWLITINFFFLLIGYCKIIDIINIYYLNIMKYFTKYIWMISNINLFFHFNELLLLMLIIYNIFSYKSLYWQDIVIYYIFLIIIFIIFFYIKYLLY